MCDMARLYVMSRSYILSQLIHVGYTHTVAPHTHTHTLKYTHTQTHTHTFAAIPGRGGGGGRQRGAQGFLSPNTERTELSHHSRRVDTHLETDLVHTSREYFSKVSLTLNLVWKMTVALNFEKCQLAPSDKQFVDTHIERAVFDDDDQVNSY